ncbi:MAG: hypothetical protein A3G34_05050 [Candidatus Lindowbacteria bacterium RIFCSPLOWO2_12_FULL_62_27]|nr:MAG: hypothetical protein A3I06_07355 [Candidatus Lindowbacteria bacterium RIFCSPLOWO2_02_FULL_62_12]OGH61357.1 MAG: hypothetical protein A3G34_05050 [Candidatus Lindowbacteria bacterium RIFCSPLOWO2_12_FULL_62_27]
MNAVERDQKISEAWRARARRLAARRPVGAGDAGSSLVLVFDLAGERHGVNLADLTEVALLADVTPVPLAPPEVAGVGNWHGELRLIVNLRSVLGISAAAPETQPPTEPPSAAPVLLLRRFQGRIGFRVDGLRDVRKVSPGTFSPATDGAGHPPGRFVKGVGPDGLVLPDLDAVFLHPLFKEVSPQ